MRKIFLSIALMATPLTVSACATVNSGQVVTTVDKGYVAAQGSFVSLQQLAFAGIKSGIIKGAAKAQIIDLVDKGQAIENRLYVTRTSADVEALIDVVAALGKFNLPALVKGN